MNTREKILNNFEVINGNVFYSHEIPFRWTNYIDGQGHIALLAYAAKLIGDIDMFAISSQWVKQTIKYNVRNLAPVQVKDSWVEVATGLWGHTKPQSFAGPCACAIAGIDSGRNVYGLARLFVFAAKTLPILFMGWPFKQHLNSVMLACLFLDEKPVSQMGWCCKDNMIYSAILGLKCDAEYPNTGPWPAKDIPFSTKEEQTEYVPVCQYVGEAMQSVLGTTTGSPSSISP